MLLRCFEADTVEPVRLTRTKVLDFCLIIIVTLPLLNLMVNYCLMLGSVVSTLVP